MDNRAKSRRLGFPMDLLVNRKHQCPCAPKTRFTHKKNVYIEDRPRLTVVFLATSGSRSSRSLILSDINKKEPAKADSSKSRHEDSLA